jgi:NADH-quinone oxidoreductase subunit J
MEQFLFIVFALVACGSALLIVLSQNVVRMAFGLVMSLGSVAALFFLLHADFIGAFQLLIYVGGTVVLLVFGVMLTSNAPSLVIRNNPAEMLQAGLIGLAFLAIVASTVMSVDWGGNRSLLRQHERAQAHLLELEHGHHHGDEKEFPRGYNPDQEGNTIRSLGAALLGLRFDKDLGTADHMHRGLSPGYLLPFEIISVHLLVVLIGAAYLARAKRRKEEAGT